MHGKVFIKSIKLAPKATTDIPQSVANTYLPPRASIWRGNKVGVWACHVKGHARFSTPWADYGGDSHAAACATARKAWMLFCRDEQLDYHECPIRDLFDGF